MKRFRRVAWLLPPCWARGGGFRQRRALTIGLMIVLGGTAAEAQDTADGSPLEARVWLDRGDQPVLQRGDRVRVYYRTSVDAHTAIFRIDTDGRVTLVRPAHPEAEQVTRGGRD